MRKYFEARYKKLLAKRENLKARCDASADAAEVRDLTAQLAETDDEIRDIKATLDELDAQSRETDPGATVTRDAQVPNTAQTVNGGVVGSYRSAVSTGTEQRGDVAQSETIEYRRAFKAFIQRGVPIPAELRTGDAVVPAIVTGSLAQRSGDTINTEATTAVIPMTIVREITNTVRLRVGQVYRKTRKVAVQGGLKFPVGEFQAEMKWITESTVSPNQDIGPVELISFDYNVGEIRIAQSFLSNVVSLSEFEAEITRAIVVAFFKAMDIAAVKGTGVGQPLGILNDPRVTGLTGHTIPMTADEFGDWSAWQEKLFAEIPLDYDDGEFIFTKGTVDRYLRTMKDDINRPLYYEAAGMSVSSGDAENPGGFFFGHPYSMVENFVLPDFATANVGDVVAIWWQPWEYAFNENFGMTIRRYFDERENKWITKLLVITDGKIINPNGVYLITKAAD